MQSLLQHLSTIHRLSDAAQQDLEEAFLPLTLTKNTFLIEEGKICRQLYFLEQGCIRGYYLSDGKEITHWFGFENDFVTSFHSFSTQQPATEHIQLLEGALLWSISREKLLQLCERHHDIERLLRMAYEKYYIRLEERFVKSQFRTAAERYALLLEQAPHIIERVPLGHIASYLGLSQETLSRVRAKL